MVACRVMTWNIRGRARPPIDRLAHVLGAEAPDVVGLQEIRAGQAEALADQAGFDHRTWALKHKPGGWPWSWASWRFEGHAILSRWPLADVEVTEVSESVSLGSHERRIVQVARVAPGGGSDLWFANTHLAAGGGRVRHRQALRLAEVVESAAGGPAVLVGDLNVEDDPAVFGPLATAGFRASPRLRAATFPAGRARRRLDHLLATTAVRIRDVWVPPDAPAWAELSDHLPVVADLECWSS